MIEILAMLLMPIIILLGISLALTFLLKEKYKPNKELLSNMNKLKGIKMLAMARGLVTFVFLLTSTDNSIVLSTAIFLGASCVIDIINTYIRLKYLGNDSKNQNTRKYIIGEFAMLIGFYVLMLAVMLVLV